MYGYVVAALVEDNGRLARPQGSCMHTAVCVCRRLLLWPGAGMLCTDGVEVQDISWKLARDVHKLTHMPAAGRVSLYHIAGAPLATFCMPAHRMFRLPLHTSLRRS